MEARQLDNAGPSSHLKYRADIDGLRAVAVLSVIAYHLHFSVISGGYAGVDIFFVISGYLITGILLKDFNRGTFSLAGFYERRARRILPALLVVLSFTAVLCYVYLLPKEFEEFAWSLLSAMFSYSNFYFWTKTSYFVADGPLLHTWSLAVEEQFYLFFPLFLMLLYRMKRAWLIPATLGVFFISFAISVTCSYKFPVANFYMPYTRAWELLTGGLVSFRILPTLRHRLAREACSLLGAALVAISLLFYTDATRFPGLSALLPCLGTAFIIFAGESGKSVVSLILSHRVFTFIGAISYSLYLWHWPVLAFNSRGFLYFGNLTHRENVAVYLAACFFLAWASWKFVETPFRLKAVLGSQRAIFLGAGVSSVAIAAIALCILGFHGLEGRYPAAALDLVKKFGNPNTQNSEFRLHQCFLVSPEPFNNFATNSCLLPDAGKKNILLLGDSHAAALWYALNNQLQGAHVLQATASSCKPFPDQYGNDDCSQLMNFIYDKYLNENKVSAVVLTARWKIRDLPKIQHVVELCRARGLPVVVIGPSEEYDSPLPVLLAYSLRNHDAELPNRHRLTQIEELDRTMKVAAESKWHVPYISLIQVMCPANQCFDYTDESRTVPVLFDHDHYTKAGSLFAVEQLWKSGQLNSLESPNQN